MRSAKVRRSFLEFFAERGHRTVASSPLDGDETLLFTNAGMVQFKKVFTGEERRDYDRAASSQKCVRAGGKHNDLDEVGKTPRHHTFFEMLGNFSFGDYFKKDAIAWAWELLTGVWKLDPERLVVTVFDGTGIDVPADDEARGLWADATGFGPERILGLGKAENFWMMGEVGPMGPCSEIHYYLGDGALGRLPSAGADDPAWADWLEIWNLVFMQYERKTEGGPMNPLPAPSIDTGAGLERVTAVLQGVRSNYDTDLFTPLIARAAEIAGKKYGADPDDDTSMRVIADHARATAFLVADGILPGKNEREYTLRRIFRRAVRHGKRLGLEEPFLFHVCEAVIETMSEVYPELRERQTLIREAALEEEKQFRRTLESGLSLLEDEFVRLESGGEKTVPGATVFQLYDTFGFPNDLTQVVAEERGFAIDEVGFARELEAAKSRSRLDAGRAGEAGLDLTALSSLPPTEFLGYEGPGIAGSGAVLGLLCAGEPAERAAAGNSVAFACDRSPFYGESGGQIGDHGVARTAGGAVVRIDDTQRAGEVIVHIGAVSEGELSVGDRVELEVDGARRDQIRANHSATHLLHLALKRVLGDHVAQKGSLVAPDRLRFDFTHFSAMTPEEKRAVEDLINDEIRRNHDSVTDVLPFEQAREKGAVAMFGEKYGARVRVVRIGGESLEFCGGTHVRRAGDIGLFKILGESGVAQGVRRIEAVTGAGALEYVRRLEGELAEAGARLKTSPLEVATRIEKLQLELKSREKEVETLKSRIASGGNRDLMSEVRDAGGIKVLATSTEIADAKALRATGDQLRDRLGSGVIVLAGVAEGKVSLLAMVSKDLTGRLHAGKLLGSVAKLIGGRGGGRPDMAQGGGSDPDKVPEALARAIELVREAAVDAVEA
jgi:alanyl-tRNA synthetase